MPNYGKQGRGAETVAEWLIGNRKWRLLNCLAKDPKRLWEVPLLAEKAGCASPTAYEFLRALDGAGAVESKGTTYRLSPNDDLSAALLELAAALATRQRKPVSRPPRKRR